MSASFVCCTNFSRPGSPGLIPGLKGVTNLAGVVRDLDLGVENPVDSGMDLGVLRVVERGDDARG